MLGDKVTLLLCGVNGRDVKIPIFEKGEGVDTPSQLRVTGSSRDDRAGRLFLDQGDDLLVMLRVVEGEVFWHQLLFCDLTVQQEYLP